MVMRISAIVLALSLAIGGLTAPAAGQAVATLTVTRSGQGHGWVSSEHRPDIDCGAACVAHFGLGSVVTLTATPGEGSAFLGWRGACTGTGKCQVTMDAARDVTAEFALSYRPDAWIKLCGLSDGCTINPLPHPWQGRNVYNSTGTRQNVSVKMEDGEGVRYWMVFENDGALSDTLVIEGCKGTPRFRVNKVQVGFYKRPQAGVTLITEAFKAGKATFDVGPSSDNDRIKLTLNIVAPTTAEGVTYHCPITVRSQGDPSISDTLDTKMTTY